MTQPSFLPTATHRNPYKIAVIVILILKVLSVVALFGLYIAGAQPDRNDFLPTPGNMAVAESRCPEGSYEVAERNGEPLCKLEPTGCPYGDSIPLGADCDKHAPENQVSHNIETVDKPVETVDKGK